jgi:RNA-directed DNA polymerase
VSSRRFWRTSTCTGWTGTSTGRGGPHTDAKAHLVRYADDFVVLARYQGKRLIGEVEGRLEGPMGLQLNREKTRVRDLQAEKVSLDFLGYTFRYVADRFGRKKRYLRVEPSAKALARERAAIRARTDRRWGWMPVTEHVEQMNRHLVGWANYFG